MEFRQLEYFLTVAETLSFGKAAKKLNVSQPAISKQIKLLEEELGTLLFDETQKAKHKRIVLTAEGSYFLLEASKIIKLRKEALEGLQRLKSKKKSVNLGLYKTLPKNILSGVLKMLDFPDYEIKLLEFDTVEQVEDAVEQGKVRLGIVLARHQPENSFLLNEGHLEVYFSESHSFASSGDVRFSQLRNENLVQCDLLSDFEVNGLSSYELNLSLIETGNGIGIFPTFYAHNLVSKQLHSSSIQTEEFLCYQILLYKQGTRSSIVQRLRDLL
jgi:DNA-binding transcriptional LysR family regulator